MTILDLVDKDISKWDYLTQFIPDLDYKISTDYRKSDNVVGHQQLVVGICWAIKEHQRTGGIGLEIGCGRYISPFCIGIDNYLGIEHPYSVGVKG